MIDRVLRSGTFSLLAMFALAVAPSAGCSSEAAEEPNLNNSDDDESSRNDITQVDHSKVKRQSIGNCWIYATTSWLEALNQRATGQEANTSESWLTYWHWFEQIANGTGRGEISTGGTYATAADLIARYGLMLEKDFIPEEADKEMSNRQSTALNAINASLKSGALKDSRARRDRKLVRAELDKAWGLSVGVVGKLNAVFGESVKKTLDKSYTSRAPGNNVIRAQDFPASLKNPDSGAIETKSLGDAIGKSGGGWWAARQGKFAWNEANYPSGQQQRRDFWKRVQRALHDEMPVITSWKVDFNGLTRDARFSKEELETRGPGRQGGHMTVMHDYQAEVPDFGLLKAGVVETRPEALEAALKDEAKIQFVRVKNSWGGIRPDRWSEAAIPGYHDLEMSYLNGPIKECAERNGETDTTNCEDEVTPLWDVVLPAGY